MESFYNSTVSVIMDMAAVIFGELKTLLNANPHVNLYTCILSMILTAALYWLFYVPYEWRKDLDDVGYDLALGNKRKVSSARRRDAINQIRRLRRVNATEMPPPYPNGWYCVLESSLLAAGKSTSVSCLGENFVVYRTLENQVHVLDAYCPHLGGNMGIGGRVIGDNIECPFHQWRFRGSDGQCVNVPYSKCVPESAKVRKWISCELNNMIFIWYHAEADETPWQLPTVEQIDSKEYMYHGCNEFYINSHIQEIPENGADIAHFIPVHSHSLLGGVADANQSVLSNMGKHQWLQPTWTPGKDVTKHIAIGTLTHAFEIIPQLQILTMNVRAEQIGPGFVRLHFESRTLGKFVALMTVVPVEPLVQKFVQRFYAPRRHAPLMKFFVLGEGIMIERDITMWNHKLYCRKPQLVKEDALIKQFRNWFAQFYSNNSKTFMEARNKLDW